MRFPFRFWTNQYNGENGEKKMKPSKRLDTYKTGIDSVSAFLAGFRFQVDYFTCWPQQDHKTLNNIVSTHVKLVLQTSGTADFETRSTRFSLGSMDCVFMPPYAVYSARTHEDVRAYEIFFHIYPITREQEFLRRLELTDILHIPGLLSPADVDRLAACYADMTAGAEGAYAVLCALLTELLVRLFRAQGKQISASGESSREQAVVGQLFGYLDAHLAQPAQVEEACRALGISQSFLYRCCKHVMGCSPIQVITRYKLQHARTLLHQPDLTIAEVAEAIGYDPYYFSNQFKKQFLISPSEYRRTRGFA